MKCSSLWVLPVASAHHLRLELQKLPHEINWKTLAAQILFGSQPRNNSMHILQSLTISIFVNTVRSDYQTYDKQKHHVVCYFKLYNIRNFVAYFIWQVSIPMGQSQLPHILSKWYFFCILPPRGFNPRSLGAVSRRICPQDHGPPLSKWYFGR